MRHGRRCTGLWLAMVAAWTAHAAIASAQQTASPEPAAPNADAGTGTGVEAVQSEQPGTAPIEAEPAPPTVEPLQPPAPVTVEAPGAATATSVPAVSAAPPETTAAYGAIAIVPAPGRRMPLDQVPRNVQRLDRSVFETEHPLGLQEALNLRLGSVVVNDVQNNPLQPDVQYRGFTASPLLGTPQGLAVFQNGVRINDAFGDVVQWDLVPEFAIQEMQLMPGASPLYGLNALGGGIALQMKDGYRAPGHRIVALGGSFGRYQASAEYGHAFENWAIYGGVSAFGEQGFRDHSQSSAQHAYVDLRQRTERQEIGIDATIANTTLRGNGPVPIELLQQRRAAIYTYPDITRNHLLMVSTDASRELADHFSLHGTAYLRHLQRDTVNGDAHEFEACDDSASTPVLCSEEGDRLRSETGHAIPVTGAVFDGVYNTTATLSDGYGGTLSADIDRRVFDRNNQLMFGLSYDGSSVDFLQRVELGYVTQDRAIDGEDVFVGNDGFRTVLGVDNRSGGAFVTDTFSISDALSLQLAGRGGFSNVESTDHQGDALDANHTFARFNPALGLTYNPLRALTLFASYSESNRAPSAIELACSDPAQPCRVPNAFLGDPPLSQVVTRAAEIGARGTLGGGGRPPLSWSLAGFGSRNFDDIIFVAGSRIGTGFFRNAGQTQRIGLEAGLHAALGRVRLFASYALLRATFESALRLSSRANPGAGADGVIDVAPGDRIPGLPSHSLKAGASVFPIAGLDLGVSVIAQSSRPFRGDEANLIENVPGYALLNAHAAYWLLENLQLFVKAQNLLNTRYETFGILADPSEVLRGTSDPRFLGPGAPLAVWAGIVVADR